MISDSTFVAISQLVADVNNSDKILVPVEDSAVDIVYSAGTLPFVNSERVNEENFIDHYRASLERPFFHSVAPEAVTMGNGMVPVREHEETLMHVKDIAAGLVTGIIDRAQNIVQPFIVNICRAAQEIPTRANATGALYDIRSIEHFSGWRSDWVSRILGQFGNVIRHDFNRGCSLSLPTPPSTIPSTGNESYDQLLGSYITEYNPDLVNVFEVVANLPHPKSTKAAEVFDRVMFTFLLLCAFEDQPWEGSNMDLATWSSSIMDSNNKLASWIAQYTECVAEEVSEGVLIRGVSAENNSTVVHVNPIVFAAFVENGGTVEIIKGMMLKNRSTSDTYYVHSNMILEKSNLFQEQWDSQVTIDRTRDSEEWLEAVRRSLSKAFASELSICSDDLLPIGVNRDEVLENFNAFIRNDVQLYNINDIDQLIMDGLHRYVFVGEKTIDLLRLIDAYLKEGMSELEAERQATINIIFEWVSDQINLAK